MIRKNRLPVVILENEMTEVVGPYVPTSSIIGPYD